MPNTTPLNEELDKLFEPLIDNPSLTLTSTYWNEAKQELTNLIQTLEKKARIDEIKELVIASGGYAQDRSYSRDETGFYVVDKTDVENRLTELESARHLSPNNTTTRSKA